MVAKQNPFLLEEYKALRAEIELHFRATLTIQPLVFTGLGGIFVLLQVNRLAIWGIPVVIAVAGIASIPHYIRMMTIGQYLQTIENQVFEDGGGWEHYLRSRRAGDGMVRAPFMASVPFFIFTGIAWLILGASAFALALIGQGPQGVTP